MGTLNIQLSFFSFYCCELHPRINVENYRCQGLDFMGSENHLFCRDKWLKTGLKFLRRRSNFPMKKTIRDYFNDKVFHS